MLQGKKLYKLFAGLMVVAMLLSACASSTTPTTAPAGAATTAPTKSITIAYSGYATSNDYWNGLGKAAAAEAQAKGVKFVDLTTETQDANAQVQAIDTEITAKPDAIIIGSVDPTVFKDTIAKAKAAGIPLLAADTAIADPYISALVQTDNLATATTLGQYICKALNGAKGSALVMAGTVGHQTGDARQKGVADALAACGDTVIKQYGNWDENTEVQIATDTITATPDLNVIFAPHGAGAAAVANVVKNKNLVGKVMVFGFDGLPVEFQAITDGIEVATAKQDNVRIGKESVDDALAIINKTSFTATDLITGIIIDKTNVAQYMAGVTPAPAATAAPAALKVPLSSITIAYSGYATSNDYWNGLGKAAAAEAQAKGVKFVDLTTETQDANAQVQAIDTEITAKPSAIIIGSVDPTVFKDTIAKAKAAGIPLLAADTAIADPYISALVQTDNLATATTLGQYICKALNGAKGSALVMAGTVGHQTGDARQKGVADALAACGDTVIKQYGNWDENTEVQIATDTITATPDLNVIFAPHGAGAAAVANVVKNKNLVGKVMVFGFDGLPVEFQAITDGIEVATAKQDNVRIGKESVDDAIAIIEGTPFTATDLITGIIIDKNNVAQYK